MSRRMSGSGNSVVHISCFPHCENYASAKFPTVRIYHAVPQLGFSRLPDNEEQICLRIRAIRLAAEMSQTEFGRLLGITRDRLASYEYARAPIRWKLGNRVCAAFLLSQRWLAEGKLPVEGHLSSNSVAEVGDEELFSVGFLKVAADYLRFMYSRGEDILQSHEGKKLTSKERFERLRRHLPKIITADLATIPDANLDEYYGQLSAFSRALFHRFRRVSKDEIATFEKAARKGGNAFWDRVHTTIERASIVHARLALKSVDSANPEQPRKSR